MQSNCASASASRSFDQDGRMTSNEFASYTYDAASRITGITQSLYAEDSATNSKTQTITSTPFTWQATYDKRHRLLSFNRPGSEQSYTYDANSNRLTSIAKKVSDTDLDGIFEASDRQQNTSQNAYLKPQSNQLIGFAQSILTQTTNAKGTLRTVSNVISKVIYELDANGNLTSDGLRTFQYGADNRLAEVDVSDSGEAAKITYLHNGLGQRTFKSEPQTAQTLPNQSALGDSFIDWHQAGRMRFHRAHKSGFWAICGVKNARRSKGYACAFCLAAHPKIHPRASRKPHEPRLKNFGWLYATAQSNATIGTAYSYADPSTGSGQALPSWALLGEYGNGGAASSGRVEYIWLPTEDGNAIPVGMFRSNRYYSIHSDHLGTPRLIKDDEAKPIWQWSYSAFGDNKPTGVLKATANPNSAVTNTPALLAASSPAFAFNLRFPGQYADSETGLFYNYYRSYQATQGRYTQADPIGLAGGMNRFGYVGANPLIDVDPLGLMGQGSGGNAPRKSSTESCEKDDKCENTITIKTSGVCEPGDTMCAMSMRAAGIQGPYYYEYKKYDWKCILKLGIGVKGSMAAGGVLAGKHLPGLGARALAAAGAPVTGAYAGMVGTTIAEISSGSLGMSLSLIGGLAYVAKHCECNK